MANSRREIIDFDDFRRSFINRPDGYLPVYSSFAENDKGERLKVVSLDMICEFRLADGKIKFLDVPFETEEQFNLIVEYLKVTAELLNKAILNRIEKLRFANTRSE